MDSLLPWTETISAHLEWWQNPTNVMKSADLHPKDHSIQLFTDASNKGRGTHLEQASTKGLSERSEREKRLHSLTIFEKFGGFLHPPVKEEIFMYLYQYLNSRPLTIDGYSMTIVDTLGPTGLHFSQNSDLNRILSSFHRDRPKSSRNLPKLNLSVVANELTKAPLSL